MLTYGLRLARAVLANLTPFRSRLAGLAVRSKISPNSKGASRLPSRLFVRRESSIFLGFRPTT